MSREIKFRAWDGDTSKGYKMHGYCYRKADYHPLATNRGYVLEHRLVMENHLGDYLPKGAVIHHINKNRADNRIENLEYIPEQSRHAKDHDNGERNHNGQFVATDPMFSEIKFRLFNKDVKQTQIYTLAKLISTTFRNSKFEFRGRFTGLKDKNGKEIYEGDLMAIDDEKGEHKFTYTVVFEDAKFVCYHVIKEYGKWGDLCRAFDADFAPYNFHVIGNIYENPELLKP